MTIRPAMDEVFTIRPRLARRMAGSTSWVNRARAKRLTSNCRRTSSVDLELSTDLVNGDLLDRAIGAVAGVVDQQVYTLFLLQNSYDSLLNGCGISQVHLQDRHPLVDQWLQSFDSSPYRIHPVSMFGEHPSGFIPDAAGGPSDQRYSIGHSLTPLTDIQESCFLPVFEAQYMTEIPMHGRNVWRVRYNFDMPFTETRSC